MLAGILMFIPVSAGLYYVLTGLFPQVHPRVARAVAERGAKKETLTKALLNSIVVKVQPLIMLEDRERQNLFRSLKLLEREETPELYHARAWAAGIFYAAGIMLISIVAHLLFLMFFPQVSPSVIYTVAAFLAISLLFIIRNNELKEVEKAISERRRLIEWELPQFSETVLQSLGHTKNVITILESYRKICGPSLQYEIERTLLEMKVGNHETALNNLAARVNSGAFTQLTQGLIGLVRGEDQRSYFQIITNDFNKSQHELIHKELLARPKKLTANNALLLIGLLLMLMVAIVGYLMDTSVGLF